MNPDLWQLLTAFIAGGAIGFLFFGGLWWTVARVPSSGRPHLLLVGSFLLRLTALLAAFYFMIPWGWQAMAMAMAGILIVRQVFLRIKGQGAKKTISAL